MSKKKEKKNIIKIEATDIQKKVFDEINKDKEEHAVDFDRLNAAVAEAQRKRAEEREQRAKLRREAERRVAHGEGELLWVATRVGTCDNKLVTVPRSFVYRSFSEAWDSMRRFAESASGIMTKVNPETNSGYSCLNGEFNTYWYIEEMDEDADPDKVVLRCRRDENEPEFEFYLEWKFLAK